MNSQNTLILLLIDFLKNKWGYIYIYSKEKHKIKRITVVLKIKNNDLYILIYLKDHFE